jgi:hypothetical protein
MKRLSLVLLCSVLVGGFFSCAAPVTLSISSTASLDGEATSVAFDNVSDEAEIGRVGNNEQRGFISFDISPVTSLDNFQISSVILAVCEANTNNLPFDDMGNVIGEIVEYGSSLDASDFNTSALSSPFTVLTNGYSVDRVYTVDITSEVNQYLSNNPGANRLQIRLRFASFVADLSEPNEHWDMHTGEITEEQFGQQRPRITITYLPE